MRHMITIAAAAVVLAVSWSVPAGATRPATSPGCGATCLSAYAAIARALPRDHENVLARAILSTPGFDYGQLGRALHVPTTREIRASWRRRCNAHFAGHARAARACYRQILGPTATHAVPASLVD